MSEYHRCCLPNCLARIPTTAAPVCSMHQGQVEAGVCVDGPDLSRRFIPVTDPECSEWANEPLSHPRRALRFHRAVHEWGLPMGPRG